MTDDEQMELNWNRPQIPDDPEGEKQISAMLDRLIADRKRTKSLETARTIADLEPIPPAHTAPTSHLQGEVVAYTAWSKR